MFPTRGFVPCSLKLANTKSSGLLYGVLNNTDDPELLDIVRVKLRAPQTGSLHPSIMQRLRLTDARHFDHSFEMHAHAFCGRLAGEVLSEIA
jgi:hypothetical protein